jgi:hypothetical protein
MTRGGEKLRLAAIGGLSGSASVVRRRGLGLELADQIDILVANRYRRLRASR